MKSSKLIMNDGFTLIEVLVAIGILVLLAIAFIPLFSSSFSFIFTYGHRDKAMAKASEYMETIYANEPITESSAIKDLLSSLDGHDIETDGSGILDYNPLKSFNYYIEDAFEPVSGIEGFKVTIAVFYKNGEQAVQLSSFIRKE